MKENKILKKHYNKEFIRKMELRGYINKIRSESKLVNNIKRMDKENKKEIMLIYGDWSISKQMRGCISTPGIGLKRRLGKDYKIMNIDEFRTSCLDNITLKRNKNAINEKTKKKIHAVLVSNILNIDGKTLKRFQNRNRNSVKNMKLIIENYKKEGERKIEFSRKSEIQDENPKLVNKIINLGSVLTDKYNFYNKVLNRLNFYDPNIKLQLNCNFGVIHPNSIWNAE